MTAAEAEAGETEAFVSEPTKNPFDPFFEEIRRIVHDEITAARRTTGLLTPEELADKLKVPVSWVYEQSRLNQIPTHRIGRYIRFDLEEVLQSQACQEKGE